MKQSEDTTSKPPSNPNPVAQSSELRIDSSGIRQYGANYCRGRKGHDNSVVLEFGVVGQSGDLVKMHCGVLITDVMAGRLIPLLQKLVSPPVDLSEPV